MALCSSAAAKACFLGASEEELLAPAPEGTPHRNIVARELSVRQAAETRLEECREALFNDWATVEGQAMVEHVCRTEALAVRAVSGEFQPIPESSLVLDFQHLHWKPSEVNERAQRALRLPPKDQGRAMRQIKTSLDNVWTGMHATVQHQSCPEVDEDEGPNVSPCHAAHMCIHEGPGLETLKMHEALAKTMTRAASKIRWPQGL